MRRFVDTFYTSVLADPLIPLFGTGKPEHVDQLTAFDSESFGGPDEFTRTMGGFAHLIDVHRGLGITEEQRQRFVELYLAAADAARLPDDPLFRGALRSTSNSGRPSPCRTRTPPAMPSSTRCARYRAGRCPTTREGSSTDA